jgi:tetratricopeptide (TPR) repeat protein
LFFCFIVSAAPTVALAAGRNEPLSVAELLVDLARDCALNQRDARGAADVQQVQTWLRAALRFDPQQTDAYAWLYELAILDGDADEAGRMVTGLLEADPTNQGAFALWLSAGVRAQQTAEKRGAWLAAVAAGQRPPALLALVHVELARLALERLDSATARRELKQALELEPANVSAATLTWQTLDAGAPAIERLRAALLVLQLNPTVVDAAWHAGLILNDYGLAEEAGRLLDHARDVRRALNPQEPPPGDLLLDVARNRLARGQLDTAIDLARLATTDSHAASEALLVLHGLLTRQGLTAEADDTRARLAKRFAALTDPRAWPVGEVAQAAWFYCTIDPQPHLALPRAVAAYERAPGDAFVRRVLGWAQALNQKPEDALQTLTPIATTDPHAAYMLAKLLAEAGDRTAAVQVLANLELRPLAGPAADRLTELAAELGGTTQPASSSPATQGTATQPQAALADYRKRELRRVWREFDDDTLDFPRAPSKYLDARCTLDDVSPGPGEPWRATLSLTNRAMFPITLGVDGMVNPVFVLSFAMEGDKPRNFPALMTLSVDRVQVLKPGQTVGEHRTLDVGPLRQVSRQTPQQLQRIVVRALLDAEQGPDGQWQPVLGGQALQTVYLNRVPAPTGREALSALAGVLTGGHDSPRWRAIGLFADLLGERQQADLKRLNYVPAAVPTDRLRSALLNLLASGDWETRVRTLDALQMTGLDRGMTEAVERGLEHEHWLVRLMTLRVLARQGPSFAARMEGISKADPDELVRALADSYLRKWAAVTLNPVTQPAP